MTSNLFFQDNVKRYDRMQQLLNDVTATKAIAFQHIDSQNKITGRVDEICKDLMKTAGFKTLEELHEAVMKTLPDKERLHYATFIRRLKEVDNLLGNVGMLFGTIAASAGLIGMAVEQRMRVIEMARDVDLRRAWNQGFHKFWHFQPIDGWKEMDAARKVMRAEMADVIEQLGEAAARELRLWNTLRNISAVMDSIAKWFFIADLAILFAQFNVEQEQRTQMRKAITAFFYYRFATVEHLKQIQATVDLYSNFEGYLITKKNLIKSHMDETAMNDTLKEMANNIITTHQPDVKDITDEHIWAACHDFDLRSKEMDVYKGDDPPENEAREWLAEQVRKREEEERGLTDEQKLQRIVEDMNKSNANSKV